MTYARAKIVLATPNLYTTDQIEEADKIINGFDDFEKLTRPYALTVTENKG